MAKLVNVVANAINTVLKVGKPTIVGRTKIEVGVEKISVYSTEYTNVVGNINKYTTPDVIRDMVRSIHYFKEVGNKIYTDYIQDFGYEMVSGFIFDNFGVHTIVKSNSTYKLLSVEYHTKRFEVETIKENHIDDLLELFRTVPTKRKSKGVAKATPKTQTVKEDELSLSGFSVINEGVQGK